MDRADGRTTMERALSNTNLRKHLMADLVCRRALAGLLYWRVHGNWAQV